MEFTALISFFTQNTANYNVSPIIEIHNQIPTNHTPTH